jgi:hypothetical protein
MNDSDASLNRSFIWDCIQRAIKRLNREGLGVYEAVRDTQGSAGIVDIVDTILERIDQSDVFVADVSIVNPEAENGRWTSNANVMMELGYALARHGKSAIVGVANTARGPIERLPFDIRAWRILAYDLTESSDRERVRDELVRDLVSAIKLSLGETEEQQIDRRSRGVSALREVLAYRIDLDYLKDGPGLVTNAGELLQIAQEIGANLHETFSPGFAGLLSKAIHTLQSASELAPTEENWKRVRDALKSACSDIDLGAKFWGFRPTLDAESEVRAMHTIAETSSWAGEATVSFDAAGTGMTEKDQRQAFESKTRELVRVSLMSLRPEHPQFSEKLRTIAESARTGYLSSIRADRRTGADMVAVARPLHDALTSLLALYPMPPTRQ